MIVSSSPGAKKHKLSVFFNGRTKLALSELENLEMVTMKTSLDFPSINLSDLNRDSTRVCVLQDVYLCSLVSIFVLLRTDRPL